MTRLGMFAKYWQPGAVKTRLAADIGEPAASRFHRACVEILANRFGDLADVRQLAATPSNRLENFAAVAPRWTIVPQGAGDLGQRMATFFAHAAAAGAERIVLIGSDSPTLPRDYIEQAFEQLVRLPVVLGPAADGGYYLIGCRVPAPPVFDRIDWSTPAVWRQTIERLEQHQISYATLPQWYDVDDLATLLRLHDELQAGPQSEDFTLLRAEVAAIVQNVAVQKLAAQGGEPTPASRRRCP